MRIATWNVNSVRTRLGQLTAWLREGRLQHVVSARVPLDSVAEAHELVETGRAVGNGQLGDIIEVENVSSGEIIQGVVEGSEKIRPIANMN